MLACARLGAPHTVVFGGFSADALRSRIQTATPSWSSPRTAATARRPEPAQPAVDEALTDCPGVEKVLVVRRTGQDRRGPTAGTSGGTTWWTAEPPSHRRAARRGAPALREVHVGHDRHSPSASCTPPAATYGVSVHARAVFDHKPETDISGPRPTSAGSRPLVHRVRAAVDGATSVMTRACRTPRTGAGGGRSSELRRDEPLLRATAIRTFMKLGRGAPAEHDLSTLRLLAASASRSTRGLDVVPEEHRR